MLAWRRYENLLTLSRALANHFSSVVQTQKVLGEAFAHLSGKSQDLQVGLQIIGR